MRETLYLIACLLIPAVWGLLVSWVFDAIEARRVGKRPSDDDSAEMYHI